MLRVINACACYRSHDGWKIALVRKKLKFHQNWEVIMSLRNANLLRLAFPTSAAWCGWKLLLDWAKRNEEKKSKTEGGNLFHFSLYYLLTFFFFFFFFFFEVLLLFLCFFLSSSTIIERQGNNQQTDLPATLRGVVLVSSLRVDAQVPDLKEGKRRTWSAWLYYT